jgi:hypothetical protein
MMGHREAGRQAATRDFVVQSQFDRTGLVCTDAVAERITQLVAPYLNVEPGPVTPGEWQVFAGVEAPASARRELVTALGEATVEYAVDHDRRDLYHVAPSSEAWITQSALRSTRAIHRSSASRQGALFLHAGLVRMDGVGIALIGGSRAGKTSLIMASVLTGSAQMVCNDDVSLICDADGSGMVGVGWPRSISVRLDTMDVLFGHEQATEIQLSLTHPANETLLSLRRSGVEPHGTALMYPWEYENLLGSQVQERTDVDALVFVSLADDPTEAGIKALALTESRERLQQRVLSEPNKHLNIFGHQPPPGRVESTVDALTALPSYQFRYDFRDVRAQAEWLTDFLGREVGGPDRRRAPVSV